MNGINRSIRGFVILLFLEFCVIPVLAQNSVYYRYDKANGLNSNTIYSIFQDSKGYLWIGTDIGLHRYNGGVFEEITIPDEYGSIEIYRIWEHSSGDIWLSTKDCKLFYYSNKVLKAYEFNDAIVKVSNSSLFFTDVWHNDNDKIVFNIRNSGSFKIDKLGNITKLPYPKTTFSYFGDRWHLGASRYNGIDFSIKNEFSILDSLGKETSFVTNGLDKNSFTQQRYSGSINQLEYSLNSTLYSWNVERKQIVITKFEDMITSIAVDSKGQTWIGMIFGGLVCLDKNHENYEQILPEFTSDFITALFFDKDDNLWVGTDKYGLIQIQPWMLQSKRYLNEDADQQAKSLICIDDTLFIGYFKSSISKVSVNGNEPIHNIVHKDIGQLWDLEYIPAWNKFISINRAAPRRYSILSRNLEFIGNGKKFFTTCLFLKQLNGRIFGFGSKNFTEFDLNMNMIHSTAIQKNGVAGLTDITLLDNQMIGGSFNGLFEINRDSCTKLNTFDEFGSDHKISALTSTKGNLFCGTLANGFLAKLKGKTIQLTSKNGLPSNNITALFIDENELYIGTSKGLVTCNINNLNQKKTDLSFLLSNDRIYKITGNKNNIFISSNTGVYQIPKNYAATKRRKPILALDFITDKETPLYNLSDQLKISRNSAFTKIAFKAIDISDNGNFYYEYKITDGSQSWIPIDNGEFLLSNLTPGKHNYEIRANRFNGPFSEVSSMMITVPKLFYETWWFIIAAGLLVFRLIILVYSFFKKRHELELKTINNELMLNQQILQAKMNPHFIFNSLNTLKLFIKKGDNSIAESYLGKFSSLLRNIFEYSNSDVTLLSNEVGYISRYVEMESQRFDNGIIFNIDIDEGLILSKIKIPSLIIQPLAENAIWHGLAHSLIEKRLDISINQFEDNIIIKIIDNGVGMERSKDYLYNQDEDISKEHSMAKTKLRFELLSKLNNRVFEISHYPTDINNKTNPGTTCELQIPYKLLNEN